MKRRREFAGRATLTYRFVAKSHLAVHIPRVKFTDSPTLEEARMIHRYEIGDVSDLIALREWELEKELTISLIEFLSYPA